MNYVFKFEVKNKEQRLKDVYRCICMHSPCCTEFVNEIKEIWKRLNETKV